MTTTESKEQRLGNYCIHSYTNKLVHAVLLEDPFMYYHLAHMLRFVVLFVDYLLTSVLYIL